MHCLYDKSKVFKKFIQGVKKEGLLFLKKNIRYLTFRKNISPKAP